MRSRRLAVARATLGAVLAIAAFAGSSGPACAQGKLDARFEVTVAGIPIGQGAWVVDVGEDQYTTVASGRVTGIMRAVTSGEGSGAARGIVNGGRLIPTSYAVNITSEGRPDEIRMAFNAGTVKDLVVDPPTPASPDRIPLTDAHRRGVIDPLTAGLLAIAGTGEMLSPEACQRNLPIFDGRQRYDLTFAFKRMERVKADHGYQGAAVVCMIVYEPLAGHRPGRAAVKYLTETRDMEIWFAPIAGTRVLAPIRIAIPTLIGPAVLHATQFATVAHAARATSTTNAKTQGAFAAPSCGSALTRRMRCDPDRH